jgi:lincosamide and streptogramin A transport system ATP-binding/permease protein
LLARFLTCRVLIMSTIICRHLTFGYDGSNSNVFSDLNLTIDTNWRTCVAGKNGRGKTTLLQLLHGQLIPHKGSIEYVGSTTYFPSSVADTSLPAFIVAKTVSGPYIHLEKDMERLLNIGDETALNHYGEVQDEYARLGGYQVDAKLSKELNSLGISNDKFDQPYESMSGGEQTRCMLAALFIQKDGFALIDEPTNHLDQEGREQVASYLRSKRGFLLVSHDRTFLDSCIDHVVALNADDVQVQKSFFSQWRGQFQLGLLKQEAQNADLKKEIRSLTESAGERRWGAAMREEKKSGALDRGFEGARAARQMKRALSIEKRVDLKIETRKTTLNNIEKQYQIKINQTADRGLILTVNKLVIGRGKPLFHPVSFSVMSGARLAIKGRNGSGKTSLLDLLSGSAIEHSGSVSFGRGLRITRSYQQPLWKSGSLQKHLAKVGLDQSQFRTIMATLGVRGNPLEQPIENLSLGQVKKIDIARTLITPSDLILWDEPLNYMDIETREQIETAVLRSKPTMVFVEHDESFVGKIATDILNIEEV